MNKAARYSGTEITANDRTALESRAGTLLDEYRDVASGTVGRAYSSGLRVWSMGDGTQILEAPKSLDDARRLVGLGR